MAARARVNTGLVELGPATVYTTASPFHHIAGLGMLAVALASGSAVACFPEFSIPAWQGLGALGVTHALVVPTMVEMLLEADALDIGTLQLLMYGGAPMHPETLRRTLTALPKVRFLQLYGQTEGSPISVLGPDAHQEAAAGRIELLRSVGRPAPGVTLEVAEPDEHGVGEIRARAAHFFRTADDGWLYTGDLGRISADGYVQLLGRRGDMIIRGGENVHPTEVEQVVAQHAGVREVAVLGVPDRRLGQTVHAVVVPADAARPPSEEELRTHVRAQLAGFKTPSSWSFVAELPRNQQGKLLRRVLVEQYPRLRRTTWTSSSHPLRKPSRSASGSGSRSGSRASGRRCAGSGATPMRGTSPNAWRGRRSSTAAAGSGWAGRRSTAAAPPPRTSGSSSPSSTRAPAARTAPGSRGRT